MGLTLCIANDVQTEASPHNHYEVNCSNLADPVSDTPDRACGVAAVLFQDRKLMNSWLEVFVEASTANWKFSDPPLANSARCCTDAH
jgi:hypothetical protein